jgi:hypothetical protein
MTYKENELAEVDNDVIRTKQQPTDWRIGLAGGKLNKHIDRRTVRKVKI